MSKKVGLLLPFSLSILALTMDQTHSAALGTEYFLKNLLDHLSDDKCHSETMCNQVDISIFPLQLNILEYLTLTIYPSTAIT